MRRFEHFAVESGVDGVLFDIDDTITTDGKLTAEAYTAMARLKAADMLVMPITGRLSGMVRRVLLHVLPTGIKRIRHYGLLALACKTIRLAQARKALAMPPLKPKAVESAADFMRRVAGVDVLRCPACNVGRLTVVETLSGSPRLPLPGVGGCIGERRPACRGPP